MPKRLHVSAPDFQKAFASLLGEKRESSVDVDDAVREIIATVRARLR